MLQRPGFLSHKDEPRRLTSATSLDLSRFLVSHFASARGNPSERRWLKTPIAPSMSNSKSSARQGNQLYTADPLRSLISCHKPILDERAVVCGYLGGHRTEEVKGKVSVRCELIQMIGPFPAHYTRTITARPSRALAAPPRPRQPSPGLTAHAGNPHLAWSPGAFAPGSLGSEWQPWKGGTRPICATNFFLVSVPRGGSARPTE